MTDLATALTQSIAANGVTTPTANLPMGGFKHTAVAAAVAADQYAQAQQVQENSFSLITAVGSSVVSGNTAYTGNLVLGQPGTRAFALNQSIIFVPNADAVGAPTLAINGGAVANILSFGTVTAANYLKNGGSVILTWNGTAWVISGSSMSQSEWISDAHAFVQVSGTSMKVVGIDVTATFTKGRRLRILHNTGATTSYATITNSVFGADTTITMVVDGGTALVATITAVSYGILVATDQMSLPIWSTYQNSRITTTWVIPATGKTEIAWNNVMTDLLGEDSGALNRFVAKYAGYYQVWLNVGIITGTVAAVTFTISLDGNALAIPIAEARISTTAAASYLTQLCCMGFVKLAAGQDIRGSITTSVLTGSPSVALTFNGGGGGMMVRRVG
jgi:hypothetical protein